MLKREAMPQDHYKLNWHAAREEAEQKGLRIIEHGWEQHVIIDESNELVYRYPRNASAAAKLDDEVAVLSDIDEHDWPIRLPVMVDHNPQFSSYAYIPGEVLTHSCVERLTLDQSRQIGQQLGSFMALFHQLDHAVVEQKRTKHDTSLLEYYERRINSAPDSNFFLPARTALENLAALDDDTIIHTVVHGDLHGPNVVIDTQTKNLKGIIDLSEMEIGDPHQEFRKIFMTFPDSLPTAIESYEQAGGQTLNPEKIILWAYVNEWANVCYFANNPQSNRTTYERALSHLRRWHQLQG